VDIDGYQWIIIYNGLINGLPSGKLTVCELENGHRKLVDLPSYKMVIFQFVTLVYQRV
jgi:hypothetical protein